MKQTPSITNQINDKEFLDAFMNSMQIITRQTGVNFVIDTKREGIAWMQPGKTDVYFNPVYALAHIQAVADKLRTEHGLETNFELKQEHLSAIVLHEINHMINHNQFKLSIKMMTVDGKTMNMIDYQQAMYQKYGSDFQRFENIIEDIDVNHHATKLQATTFEQAKQDIYRYVTAPSGDFSQETLSEQFAWTCLRESMLNERCMVDPIVRNCIDYLSANGGSLETLRNPTIPYDEQFPLIVKLYEDYYLPLREKSNKKQQEEEKGNKGEESENNQGTPKQGQNSQGNSHPEQSALGNESSWGKGTSQNKNPLSQGQPQDGQGQGKSQPGEGDNQANIPSKPIKSPPKPTLIPHLFDNLDPEGKPIEKKSNTNSSLKKTKRQLNDALTQNKQPSTNPQAKSPSLLSEAIKQSFNDAIERKILNDRKTPEDRSLEETIARERNLDPEKDQKKIDDLKPKVKQRKEEIEPSLKNLRDRDGKKVHDYIVDDVFSRIVSLRSIKTITTISPQSFLGGGQFDPTALVGGVMSWKAGDPDPLIMRQEYHSEKTKPKASAFNITLGIDGSRSMSEGTKNRDQKLNTLVMLNALNECNAKLEKLNLGEDDFRIETQVIMFQGSGKVKILKARSSTLSLPEIISLIDDLDYADGKDTNAYDAMKLYHKQLLKPFSGQSESDHKERLEKLKDRQKIKEILLLLSDGGFNSGDDVKAKKINTILREMGVISCGMGITADGSPMVNIFGEKNKTDPDANAGGFGVVCDQTADLGVELNSLLLEHLVDPSIVGEEV